MRTTGCGSWPGTWPPTSGSRTRAWPTPPSWSAISPDRNTGSPSTRCTFSTSTTPGPRSAAAQQHQHPHRGGGAPHHPLGLEVIIQIVLVPALVLAVLLSLRSRASLRGQARRKILAVLTVAGGVLAVLFPNTLQALADLTGVTRGTDLLLSGLALVIIYLVGSTSAR